MQNFKSNPFFLSDEDIEWVNEIFDSMTLDDKVGQLFVTLAGFFGRKKTLDKVLSYKPGGVTLMANLSGIQRRKVKYLQENSKIPILISGDLEMGGLLGVLNGTFFNTNMGIGATDNEEFAYKCGLITAREGTAVGFNWSFSPVVDINYNHQNPITNFRSFGDRPDLVSKMSVAYIKGVQESGTFSACAKHFPGDGVDDRNQHLSSTINSFDMDKWRQTYGKLYKDVIDAGVKTIMIGHIGLPAYDNFEGKSVPGTLSEKLLKELLRKELGFNGLILSDATDMAGFNSQGPRTFTLPQTVNSGCDIILFSSERDSDYRIIRDAVENGVISKERLNEAVKRILAFKASLKLHKRNLIPKKQEKKKFVKCKDHIQWSNECIKSSITLVKDTRNIIPISPEQYKKVLLVIKGNLKILMRKFKSLLEAKGFKVKKYKKGINKIYKNYDLIIFLLNEGVWYTRTTLRLLNLTKDAGMMRSVHNEVPSIFISLGNPYHLYEIPTMKTLINCYNPIKRTQKILVDMLTGNIPFKGISPVDAFCGLNDAKP